jgi:hypothetical protein
LYVSYSFGALVITERIYSITLPGRYTVETPPSFRNGKHKKKNTTTVIFFCIYYNFLKNMRRLILYSMAFGCYHISEQFRLISIVYSNYKEFHTVISNWSRSDGSNRSGSTLVANASKGLKRFYCKRIKEFCSCIVHSLILKIS